MPTTYTTAGEGVMAQVRAIVRRFHRDLDEAEVTFNVLFAHNNEEPALKASGGWPAAANRIKMHDFELGGFEAVIDRHKHHAIEFESIKRCTEIEVVQRAFFFMQEEAAAK